MMNCQFGFYMKHKTFIKINQIYPDVNIYFDNPARSNGSQK